MTKIRTFFQRLWKGEHYELAGQTILAHKGPFGTLSIPGSEIKRWAIIPEMGADFVHIELRSGEVLLLTDKHNDLIAALDAVAKERKVGDEYDWL